MDQPPHPSGLDDQIGRIIDTGRRDTGSNRRLAAVLAVLAVAAAGLFIAADRITDQLDPDGTDGRDDRGISAPDDQGYERLADWAAGAVGEPLPPTRGAVIVANPADTTGTFRVTTIGPDGTCWQITVTVDDTATITGTDPAPYDTAPVHCRYNTP